MRPTKLFRDFFESEKSGGLILVVATILSLTLANSAWSENYIAFWSFAFSGHTVTEWINDGLMAIFFLLIGLELEREIYKGELSSRKKAALPLFGALGGMVIPAAIFYILNSGTSTQTGVGIPMATDIAFAIGILSLLGNRVPLSLKIFLTALAVIDDLGAIMVIAVFYTKHLSFVNLGISLAIFVVLLILNRLKVRNLIPYLLGGIVMWYFMLLSGVHATITGVLLPFAIPFGNGGRNSTSFILQHCLHKPVAFFILPIFALANTGIIIEKDWQSGLMQVGSIGILLGLVIGKPLGIWLFSFVAVRFGVCKLPPGMRWNTLLGAGILAGIGFTMSVFITLLAFDDPQIITSSKIAILLASTIAAILGFIVLKVTLKKRLH
ncbi:MAG TPA: Na+/H+ antiporter NhaA [Flavobacterium sp.]|jgi:NhaA family Na+:H+ antiporter